MATKRGITFGDLHSGHRCGLTPPAWHGKPVKGGLTKHNKWQSLRKSLWNHWVRIINEHGPFDFALYLGDGIDGRGERSGGTELLTTDREEQTDMAVECINQIRLNANKGFSIVGVYGTPYHTGSDGEDWENVIADRAGFSKVGAHEWVDVNGYVFDLKHDVGSSSVPHGRHTAVSREHLWAQLWAERDLIPKANAIIRGHVHYHNYCGGPDWVAMTLPALQGMGSKFGSRRCSGLVDFGAVIWDIDDSGNAKWHSDTVFIKEQKARTIKL